MKIKQRALIGLLFILAGNFTVFSDFDSACKGDVSVSPAAETDTGTVSINAAGHEITLWHQDGQSYAFLPSACKGMDLESKMAEESDADSIVWMCSENIPAVFIDTESGTSQQIHADKNVKEAGEISVLGADGVTSFRMPLSYIKSRGNTSFTSFEKSRIRLNSWNPLLSWAWMRLKNGFLFPMRRIRRFSETR